MLQIDQAADEVGRAALPFRRRLERRRRDWQDFLKQPWIAFPLPTSNRNGVHSMEPQIQQGQPFATQSGKFEVYNSFLANPSPTTWGAINYAGLGPYVPYGWYTACSYTANGDVATLLDDSWTTAEFNQFPLFMTTPHSMYRQYQFTDMNPLLGDCSTVADDPNHSGDVWPRK